jgi:hypothetical protein
VPGIVLVLEITVETKSDKNPCPKEFSILLGEVKSEKEKDKQENQL